MAANPVDLGMGAGEILRRYPASLEVFDHHGIVFCAGCFLTLFDPLGDVAGYHAVHDVDELVRDLNAVAAAPTGPRPAWAEGSGAESADSAGGADGERALAPARAERVRRVLAADPVAAALGLRLGALGEASARVAAPTGAGADGRTDAALAAALSLFAVRAASLAAGAADGRVLDLRLGPLGPMRSGGELVAHAHRAALPADGRATTYHVRLADGDDAPIGLGSVLLAERREA